MRLGPATDDDWRKQGIGNPVVSFEFHDEVHQGQLESRVFAAKETCHEKALELGEVGHRSPTLGNEFSGDAWGPSRILRTLDLEEY